MSSFAGCNRRVYQDFMLRLKFAAQYCVDSLLGMTRTPKGDRHPSLALIVRLDGIGDFVLWLDAARATARHYRSRGSKVILVANSLWADWAGELGIFDDVIALDRAKFDDSLVYRWCFGRRVRMLGCAIAVNPTYSREWLFGDAIVRVSGARQRIGSASDLSRMCAWQRWLGDQVYTRVVPADAGVRMELVRNAEFVRGLGDGGHRAKVVDLAAMNGVAPDENFTSAIGGAKHYYVIFPGSAWGGKRWPLSSFAQVAERICEETGWRGVICGGPEDVELGEALCALGGAQLVNWSGRTNLAQLVAIISNAELLVGNDSSATHIAAACAVPAVCVLGGGHYGRFLPYQVELPDERPLPRVVIHRMPCFGCGWLCIYGTTKAQPHPCIDGVTLYDVWAEVDAILEQILTEGRAKSMKSRSYLQT